MHDATAKPMRVLYLTARDPDSGDDILSSASRVAIGMLSRDFTVSLAVAGDINTVGMNRLRVDLGPIRVAGGLESSSADRRAAGGLRRYMREHAGTDMINARLQSAIQRKAAEFDAVVIDDVMAWPYRPVLQSMPVIFLARAVLSVNEPQTQRLWSMLRGGTLRDYERAIFDAVDYVFARPEVANTLSDIGVPMGLLRDNFSRPGSGRPTFDDAVYSLTGDRIGYTGYLGSAKNVASLEWFLSDVWPAVRALRPDVELHVVGSSPDEGLQHSLARLENVYLHWGSTDHKLLDLGCRVVIDPLLYEDHVDAKLINAMTRSIPVVTTRSALARAHNTLQRGFVAAADAEDMAIRIDEVMSNPAFWRDISNAAREIAAEALPDFEVAHALRRVLDKLHRGEHREH